jgi:hypothetical protein
MTDETYPIYRNYVERMFEDYLLKDKDKEEKRIILNALRVLLSGHSVGPPIYDLITIIWLRFGIESIRKRINKYNEIIGDTLVIR